MLRPLLSQEGGFALIEVVVSAVIVLTIAGGSLLAIESSGRSAAAERARAQAQGVAQEDQSRLRAFRVADLSNLNETRTVEVGTSTFTVRSIADFVTDSTGTASCVQGTARPDYIRITSRVTWSNMGGRPPVLVQSIVAPPNGTIASNRGALAVSVKGGADQAIPGIMLEGAGPDSFSGETSETGCVIFGNLPTGNYSLTPIAPGYVDKDGQDPVATTVGVVAQSTNTVVIQLDEPGALEVSFQTRVGSQLVPSSADSLVVFNTGMTRAHTYPAPSRQSALVAEPLFPFASPDTVYAGSCTANNPNPGNVANSPGAPALASAMVEAGLVEEVSIQLPALDVTVRSGNNAGSPGSLVSNAKVVLTDADCAAQGVNAVHRLQTGSNGKLADPGLPWSTYNVCIEAAGKRVTQNGVAVKNLTTPASLTAYMGAATTGTCP